MSSEIAIRVQNLSKCYQIYDTPRDRLKQFVLPRLRRMMGKLPKQYFGEFWALKDVSFEVKKGETVGIIGRNGSGKSTLLQMICGTLNPTSGTIQTNGRIAALLELGSGFNPEFSGRENVYMNAAVLGLNNEEIDARFDDIVAFADIGDFIDQPVKTYSSGMYIRLAFSVAINVKPDILIVDEALSVGDIRFQSKCIRAIQEIKEKGAAILFVTHSTGQIEALCNRAVWLNDGLLKAEGLPKNLMRRYVNFMVHGIDGEDVAGTTVTSEISPPKNLETSTSQWVDITAKNNVKGNLSAVISKIMVRRENGEPLDVLYAKSQKIEVTFSVEAHSDVYKPILGVGIFNALNEPIIHFNTDNAPKHINQLPAGTYHTFNFSFDVPALRPGEYLISIGIDDGIPGVSTVLFHVYDAWPFTVALLEEGKAQAGYIQIENSKEAITHNIGL
jgi:lipopolysaccharide transport system ATP-binding protein